MRGCAKPPQIRALLERQLRLLTSLDQRCVEVKRRRGRAVAELRTLALFVAELRSRSTLGAEEERDPAEISGRIRVLCRETDAHLAATSEMREVLQ